MITRHTKL